MPSRPTDRPPLTPQRIIDAAVEVADRGGVAAVSMRKVAEALDVEAMALYHHVPNKDAIVDGIVDAVFGEIDLPRPDLDWRAALESRGRSARRTLSRHSWVLGLIESHEHVGPHRLRQHDAALGVLLGAGFSPAEALVAVSVLDSYVSGFVLQEQQHGVSGPAETERAAAELAAELRGDDLPHLRAVAESVVTGAPSHDVVFSRGLRIVLDGLSPDPGGGARVGPA
ncbi:TetR/AcrR family transcriptional regulator C-terminal domain-containing protein [Agromyces tropicus]|uniref:TetR/AcrR family transcriptional regulator C-terminal domain-containing protein n=1 Tax=Agromyces tropicus TaxID=555371 RepID=A0ABN2UIW0_9MICO